MAKTGGKKQMSEDDEGSMDGFIVDSDDEDDVKPARKKKARTAKGKK